MARPFVSSSKRRDFSLFDIAKMSEDEAFWFFVKHRWGTTETQYCPECGVVEKHYFRVKRKQWKCRSCERYFSVTSGTPLADHKLSFHKMLMAIFLYSSSVKGISSVDLAATIDVNVGTAFILIGKFRECLLRQRDSEKLTGLVHIDGGHFGGKPRKPNIRKRSDHTAIAEKVESVLGTRKRAAPKYGYAGSKANQVRRKNRRIVINMRAVNQEKGLGAYKTIVSVAMAEDSKSAETLARRYIEDDTFIMTDENAAYARFSQWYTHDTVEHAKEFCTVDGVNENQAESYFSRLRRYEYGIGHRITPKYLMDLANEMAWREDTRRYTEGERLKDLFCKVFKNGLSRWWRGYHQGHHRKMELLMM